MPSPLGHALSGLIIASVQAGTSRGVNLKRLLLGSVFASAPDLDMLLVFTGRNYTDVHRTFSHSLITVFSVFLLLWGYDYICAIKGYKYRVPYILISVCLFSHICLDLLCVDTLGPKGIMLLWPISATFFYPDINIFSAPWAVNGNFLPLISLALIGIREVVIIGFLGVTALIIVYYVKEKYKL